jgi:hypothetical protein
MTHARGIDEAAYDLAVIIDPQGRSRSAVRARDLGENSIVQEKATTDAAGIVERAHDLAAIVDPEGSGQRGPWEIDLGEGQFILMVATLLFAAGFLVCKGDC